MPCVTSAMKRGAPEARGIKMKFRNKKKSSLVIYAVPTFLAASLPGAAMGQEPSSNGQPAAASATVADVVVSTTESPSDKSQAQATALQTTPVTATIVTQDQLENLQITNLSEARKLVPSLQIKWNNLQNLTYNIRAFGNSTSSQLASIWNGVPIYVDGVFMPRPGTWTTDIPDLLGIQVLKGPQMGGADSIGGVVLITTSKPSFTPENKVEFSYGTYNYRQLKASATGPIADSDKLAFRLSIYGADRDGYIQSINNNLLYNDWHDKGARAQLLYQPDNDLTARFTVDYSHDNTTCCVKITNGAVTQYLNGSVFPNNFFVRSARLGYTPQSFFGLNRYNTDLSTYWPTEGAETYGASADINYNINGFTISSISAFRQYDYHPHWLNNTTINLDTNTASHGHPSERSVQEEFKISTPKGEPVEATAGLFFFWEQFRTWGLSSYGSQGGIWYGNPTTPAATALANTALNYLSRISYTNPTSTNVAPYAQAVWHATPEIDLTAGVRYSYTARSAISEGVVVGQSLNGLTPAQQAQAQTLRAGTLGPPFWYYSASTHQGLPAGLASASYKFTPDVMGYVTYSHGVRAGGPNVSTAFLPAGATTTVKAETVDNYEIGLKSQWFDQRLMANIAAFVMNNRNYITNVTAANTSGTTISYLANAPGAISRGVEVELRARPIDGLNLFASGTYNDAFYSAFPSAPCPIEQSNVNRTCDFTGKQLSITSRWSFVVGGQYNHPLGTVVPFSEKPVTAFIGADYSWQSSLYADTTNSIYSIIPAYGLLNLNLGAKFDDGSWSLTGWIHNALNQHYWTSYTPAGTLAAGLVSGTVGDPIMGGVTIAAKW